VKTARSVHALSSADAHSRRALHASQRETIDAKRCGTRWFLKRDTLAGRCETFDQSFGVAFANVVATPRTASRDRALY
jgi:hypothetical protein